MYTHTHTHKKIYIYREKEWYIDVEPLAETNNRDTRKTWKKQIKGDIQ